MTNRPTTRALPTTDAAPGISHAARRACLAFGLIPHAAPASAPAIPPHPDLLRALEQPGVVLLTGPSGSGKTRRLRGILRATTRRAILATPIGPDTRAAFDAVRADPARTLQALAAAGLAEPALWVRPACALSAGERARLSLARAFAHARPGDLIVCDEFASHLDRPNAQSLAATAARWCSRERVTLLAASAHDDLTRFLTTTAVLDTRTGDLQPGRVQEPIPVRIEPGTRADLATLAHHHYRAGAPATLTRILRAVRTMPDGRDELAGVLVVSMPVLNALWRPLAWPGRFEHPDRRTNARIINSELRCISRVITAPSSRGLGIATALVRASLAHPETPCTEAVAAMGACCPFFRAAGMTEYHLPRTPHDARLQDALDHAHLTPTDLLTPQHLPPFIQHELTRWSKHARIHPSTPPHPHATTRLLTTPRAYAHDTTISPPPSPTPGGRGPG